MTHLDRVVTSLHEAFRIDLDPGLVSIEDFLGVGRHLAIGWGQVENPELDRRVAARSALTLALVAGAIVRRAGQEPKSEALVDDELAFLCSHLEYLSPAARLLVYPMALEAFLTKASRGERMLGDTVAFHFGVEWLRLGQFDPRQQRALLAAWMYLACPPDTDDDDAARALLWALLMTDAQDLPIEVTRSLHEVYLALCSSRAALQLRAETELTPSDAAGWLDELAEAAGIKPQEIAWARLTPELLAERLRTRCGGNSDNH